jgi:uncharacterized membrane protein
VIERNVEDVMSDTAASRTGGGRVTLSDVGGGLRNAAAKNEATQRLLEEGEAYLAAQMQRMVGTLGAKIGETTRTLTDVAEGKTNPTGMVADTVKNALGGSSPAGALAKAGMKNVADKAKSIFKRGGKGGSGGKSMNIVEDIEIGLPLRTVYNHWTQFQEFPKWSKGAQSVDQEDPTKSNWKAKIAWSNRSWTATTLEQVPDERISWQAEGQTVVNGVVSFHPIEDQLTKVVMVLEYIPHGFVEKTANLWRAPGRRARLDLKLFRRYVMLHADPEDAENGWRGEIHDGEVVREHDDAVKEEEKPEEEAPEADHHAEEQDEESTQEEPAAEGEPEAGEDEKEEEEDKEPARMGRRTRPPRQRRSEDQSSKAKSRR